MQFPIDIAFKILALAPQLYVKGADGQSLGYVKQKLLAFKEKVTVFTDETQTTPIYTINADRVIDFSANYHIANAAGQPLGSVGRKGMRSIWKAHYVISIGDQPRFEVHEESAIVKFLDSLVGEIPVVGMFTGYFLNPTYLVTRIGSQQPALRMVKKPAFLESHFTIDQHGPLEPREQETVMLALMMVVLLERARG